MLDENTDALRRCDVTQFIAGALVAQGRNEEAEAMLRQAIEARTGLAGLSQPANIKALRNLAGFMLCAAGSDGRGAGAQPIGGCAGAKPGNRESGDAERH
ncbi:MAG: hypothetical protein WDN28_06110 [Chthoniobacter sp.]